MAESETPHCLIPTTLRLLSGREISPCIVLLALRPPMTNNRATKKELSTLVTIICTDRRPRQDTCGLQNKPVYAKNPTSLADYHLETITCWELQGWPAAAVRGHKHMIDVNCVSPLGPSEKCKLSALQDRFECFDGLECQPINPLIYANTCPSTSWTCIKDLHVFSRCEHKVSSMNTDTCGIMSQCTVNVETSRDLFLPEIVSVQQSKIWSFHSKTT